MFTERERETGITRAAYAVQASKREGDTETERERDTHRETFFCHDLVCAKKHTCSNMPCIPEP